MTSLDVETRPTQTTPLVGDELTPGAPGALQTTPARPPARLAVAHVADHYRRYPGESVTLHSRVEVLAPVRGFRLTIGLPEGLTPGEYRASPSHGERLPELVTVGEARFLVWTLERVLQPGERFEYELEATVTPTGHDLRLESRAVVTARPADPRGAEAAESVEIAVLAKGRYLRYLPALYQEDELMGRFLMLFESFWGPIERQIESLPSYFDPRLTPASLLPWLASWLDLTLDDRWPEERRRRLLSAAGALYRKRGTRQGLQEYLEIYTGEKAHIVEHSAHNMRLGLDARLGLGLALGRLNMPFTFTVVLRLPPASTAADEAERNRREQERRRAIESIIEAEKPAHTAYNLHIEAVA
jgi:phage tail-like protein